MSTSKTILLSAYSIQSAKSGTVFGQLSSMPMRSAQAGMLAQVSLAGIPKNATITNAFVRINIAQAYSGSLTASVYRRTATWPAKVTWANRGALTTAIGSKTLSSPKTGAQFDIPVTAMVQQMVSGTVANRGLYIGLDTSTSAALKFWGPKASGGRPALYVTYTVTPPTPTNLEPSDAVVSDPAPTLVWAADPSIAGMQVQVDPTANATSPAFDSGQVATTGGLYDLAEEGAAAGFVPLTDGQTTMWRVRQQTSGGWSPWTAWVPFTYTARPELVITSPAGTPDANGRIPVSDGTPPLTWTFAGTQAAWRARLLSETGAVIADSGRLASTDTDWTPPLGLVTDGQTGTIELTVWDTSGRASSPGHPAESIDQVDIVLDPDPVPEPFAGTTVTGNGWEPELTITGHRSEIPDFVTLDRDGREVARYPGVDVMAPATGGGYTATVTDLGARMNRDHTWSLRPVVNNAKGPVGAVARLVPRCMGIWLYDQNGDPVVLWGDDSADQAQTETAIVHQPLGESAVVAPVRRRLVRAAASGSLSGRLISVAGGGSSWPIDVMEARLRAWAQNDAGDPYTLILGNYSGRVILGDITILEQPLSIAPGRGSTPTRTDEPTFLVTANWWDTGAVI